MNKCITLILLLLISAATIAQHKTIDWEFLSKVEWEDRYFPKYDETVWYPDFSKPILELDSTLIQIEGYIIPVDVESGYYVLSANPYTSCFFCGNAGPESVMELQMPDKKKVFKTDEVVVFTGRLKLNWDDLEHCNYILQNAYSK